MANRRLLTVSLDSGNLRDSGQRETGAPWLVALEMELM